ncbi:EAL and HDOD domain-containing protein [Candidatus Contendibacter odensensis]|uniref:Signal transduction protein n=1 Tax=Candidatus Contendobacter odensis Run_B_J11 TaxID=1400861 RepID=A0A7U7GEN2_9GAMM|nr:HDOD domain-containing protein [Candidatus Contendobacter odensis]CDH46998.1 putative signal transduction protein [Candidatus Contendobacter odensis Run_B_J11]
MKEIYLGRQPIYEANFRLEGYELSYHPTDAENAGLLDSELSSSQVLFDTLAEVGLERLVGSGKAFLSAARELIVQGYLQHTIVSSPQMVFQISTDIMVDTPLIDALRALRQQGYHFLLDNYADNEAYRALLDVAEYARIDMVTTPASEAHRIITRLQQRGVALIAGGIEDQEVLESCQALRFNFFQGRHFSQPRLLKFKGISTNHLTVLRLISALNQPDVDMKTIETVIAQDVSLSYKLLRYINSAYFNLSRRIDSIQRAVTLLGLRNIRSWATLRSMSAMDNTRDDLQTIALVRAKMCEELAAQLGLKQREMGFTVGLLSVLDLVAQAPMSDVLATLPLDDEINAALLRHEGLLGKVLACTLAYEQCDWATLTTLGLDAEQVNEVYLTALADAYKSSYELLRG